jgi:gamma-glutamyltranspeptidase/glutathione hydrolase
VALSERFGKLPFEELMQPAIETAERGFLLSVVVQEKWAAPVEELKGQPGFAQAFLPRGRAPEVGELFQFAAAAQGLRAIGKTKGQAFYGGEIAEALERFSNTHGGSLKASDFAAYQAEWVKPIAMDYRGHTLHEIPPNGQGIAALIALGILDNFDLAALQRDGVDSQHVQIEAMKLAFADVYRYVAEESSMEVTAAQMLDKSYLKQRAKLIDMQRAQDFKAGNPAKGGTIYLTAADENGMMVSFIQSNYMGFGSGCVEPTFGVSLQNRGHAFAVRSGGLNPANLVAPGKRPFHTIIPAFLTQDGQPVMSYGVMGANMQPQGHVQTLVRMLDYAQNPQAACDAPRWRYNEGLVINVEAGMDAHTVQGLQQRGHAMEVINDSYQDFGSGQFIWRMGDPKVQGYVAASDSRRDGLVAGF